jgi:hypothetical protein
VIRGFEATRNVTTDICSTGQGGSATQISSHRTSGFNSTETSTLSGLESHLMLVADNVTRHRSAVSNRVGSSECFPRSMITCTFFNCLESSNVIVSIYMKSVMTRRTSEHLIDLIMTERKRCMSAGIENRYVRQSRYGLLIRKWSESGYIAPKRCSEYTTPQNILLLVETRDLAKA